MATDWSARTAAIEHFEKIVKQLKRANDDDKELYEAALHALRRSQDHTAIQNKLQSFRRERDELVTLLRELIDIDGPQPGHVMWARKVQDAIAKIAP